MNPILHYSLLLLIPSAILLHLYISPYTKVEESFNIQAIHDLLVHPPTLRRFTQVIIHNYDHIKYPGSVPRTFVGALVISEMTRPFMRFCSTFLQLQILVRAMLGLLNAGSLIAFQQAVAQAFGRNASYWFILLQASQFHVMYYASRTLPNFFAFFMTTLALRFWILSSFGPRPRKAQRAGRTIFLLTAAGIIFRSELAILLAMLVGTFVFLHGLSIQNLIIPKGLKAAVYALCVTVGVDSLFWRQLPIWPEWTAFKYNTIQGKSADWGVSAWHYYFTNAIPKLMMNPAAILLFIPVAVYVKSTRRYSLEMLTPLLAFVLIYSLLPHKEWRFIVYIVPGLTAVAAAGASWIWSRRTQSLFNRVLSLILVTSVIATFLGSVVISRISSLNYPGAVALEKVHNFSGGSVPNVWIYMDDLTCQTGATRFLEANPNWIYDKSPSPKLMTGSIAKRSMVFSLAEDPIRFWGDWETIDTVKAYAGISLTQGTGILTALLPEDIRHDTIRRIVEATKLAEQNVMSRTQYWPRIRLEPRIYVLLQASM